MCRPRDTACTWRRACLHPLSYAGQCNDAFFQLPKKKAVTFILDAPVGLSELGVMCKSGQVLSADMLVNASGCKFNTQPQFLQALNTGKLL